MHLKKTVRGPRRVLRGRSVPLVRQEARALVLIHNMIAAIAAQAASSAGIDPGALFFTAVLSLVLSRVIADTCCRHCGRRPASADDPLAPLTTAIIAHPRDRTGRQAADLRPDPRRTTGMAHRRSDVHPHDHPVKSSENRHMSQKLRAVPLTLLTNGSPVLNP